ncbi:MAG TPA: diguanylate cyclase [Anaerolineales bacterium]|nr:diguanylate cyclase [Anaerolineales bacterium]
MNNTLVHEFELYSLEKFNILFEHEINRSRRSGENLTLIHLLVETSSSPTDMQHGAEVFAISVLNVHLRATDIPCREGNKFLVLMPSTDEAGGRIVCQRIEKLFKKEAQVYEKMSFKLSAYIGLATLPGDRSLSSNKLTQNTSKALELAREKQLINTVVHSEIKS